MNEARGFLVNGADDSAPDDKRTALLDELAKLISDDKLFARLKRWDEHMEQKMVELQAENDEYRDGLREIASADGLEARVLSSLAGQNYYMMGVKEQAQRARARLGEDAPPDMPANLLLERIERLEAERDVLMAMCGRYSDELARVEAERDLALRVAYQVLHDREYYTWQTAFDDTAPLLLSDDSVTLGDVRKVLAMYAALEKEGERE